MEAVASHLRNASEQYGKYWRKSARAPGAEKELAGIAIEKLRKLQLVSIEQDRISPLPAIARFSLGHTDIRTTGT